MIRKRLVALAALAALLVAVSAASGEAPLTWGAAFPVGGAPASLHFRATYTDARGGDHVLEVWRDHDRRLRRKTDDALDLYVDRAARGEYAYRLVDHARAALLGVTRTNLYRIGVFSDWAGLAHVVTPPPGDHRLVRVPGRVSLPAGVCTRVRIERAAGVDEVCWSEALGVPLRIRRQTGGAWQTTFAMTAASRAFDAAVFAIDTAGLRVVNADDDIDPSSEQ